MRLRELQIKNFRKIKDLTITFPKGLCVLVGENNSGKTAIIDALRLMLYPAHQYDALHLNEDDFRDGTEYAPIEISCTFIELTVEDEAHFMECLVDKGDEKFEMKLNTRVEFNKTTRRANPRSWGGETEGGALPSNLYDKITAVYLQPLRDPASGLRPGRYSQISRLIDRLTDKSQHEMFESIAKESNKSIRGLKSVKTAEGVINDQMTSIAGDQLAQNTEIVSSDPTFHRIIAGLLPKIDKLPFGHNGLGYNNLIFTSATLGTLKKSPQFSFRSILVEEPEAHLHPQLQVLLLQHLADVTKKDEDSEIQVIVSSHSPVLVSQAPLDSIVSIHENDGKLSAVSIGSITMDPLLKKKLQRFLDATRGELFFARRLLMVEGISEVLLLPVLARIAGKRLEKSAVTVLNADGINFNAFLPLFQKDCLSFPVAILSDGDPKEEDERQSFTAQKLKESATTIPNLCVELSEITFEHELARSSKIFPLMLDAFEALHPKAGPKLKRAVAEINSADEKADVFLEYFKRTVKSKGRFAQELAALMEKQQSKLQLQSKDIPQYIVRALVFLNVIDAEESND